MVLYKEKDNKKILFAQCDCVGNHGILLEKYEDDDEIYLSILNNSFSFKQESFWEKLKIKAKMIWYILIGKEYRLEEIVIDSSNLDDLIKNLIHLKGYENDD